MNQPFCKHAPRALILIVGLLCLLLASGCGQRGPLYLPDHQNSEESATEPPAPAEDDEES